MSVKLSILLFVFSLLFSGNIEEINSIKRDCCTANFEIINVRKIELGCSKEDIDFINDENIVFNEFIPEEGKLILTFQEKYMFSELKIINYKLIFKADRLISYNFMIEIEKNQKGIIFFKKIIKILKEDLTNDFIIGDKYSYISTEEKCTRFIRMHSVGSKEYIFAGIKY